MIIYFPHSVELAKGRVFVNEQAEQLAEGDSTPQDSAQALLAIWVLQAAACHELRRALHLQLRSVPDRGGEEAQGDDVEQEEVDRKQGLQELR